MVLWIWPPPLGKTGKSTMEGGEFINRSAGEMRVVWDDEVGSVLTQSEMSSKNGRNIIMGESGLC